MVGLVEQRDLPGERPGRRDDGDEAGDPVIRALGDVKCLRVEEEHLLEVLLEPARALEVVLQCLRRRRVGVAEAVVLAVFELPREDLGETRLDRGDDGLDAAAVRRLRLRQTGETSFGPRERLEEPHADVFVDELSLALQLGGLDAVRARDW